MVVERDPADCGPGTAHHAVASGATARHRPDWSPPSSRNSPRGRLHDDMRATIVPRACAPDCDMVAAGPCATIDGRNRSPIEHGSCTLPST